MSTPVDTLRVSPPGAASNDHHLYKKFFRARSLFLQGMGAADLPLRASLVSLVMHDRILLFARDLREKQDWPEVLSVRVAPVEHVSPGSLTIYEERTT